MRSIPARAGETRRSLVRPSTPARSIPARAGETSRRGTTRRPVAVDPRARGGNLSPLHAIWRQSGRSPRARGKQAGHYVRRKIPGSIPARAGETVPHGRIAPACRVDPRARGGNIVTSPHAMPTAPDELSVDPRARGGNRPRCALRSPRERLTLRTVDPRARGGNAVTASRGDPARAKSALPVNGSIPARAGETAPRPAVHRGGEVDPRARGGNTTLDFQTTACKGRSPRARGKLCRCADLARCAGSIPARAGETLGGRSPAPDRAVDPRARGGNCGTWSGLAQAKGRSPRARGKLPPAPPEPPIARSIPARAGETRGGFAIASTPKVDPRARGGNADASAIAHATSSPGSGRSPRARGKPSRVLQEGANDLKTGSPDR